MPSYVKSQAITGLGTILSINTGTSAAPVWTVVSELKSLTQSGRQFATEDVTNFQSSKREFIATLADSGSWKLEGSRVSGDAGQIAMEAAFATGALQQFQIQLPKTATQTTAGDQYGFYALIQDLNYSFAVEKADTFTATLKVSGDITETPGS